MADTAKLDRSKADTHLPPSGGSASPTEDIPTRFFRTKFGITPDGDCSDSQKKMLASYSEIQRIVKRYHDLWITQKSGKTYFRLHDVRMMLLLPLDAVVKIEATPQKSYNNFVTILSSVLTGKHPDGLEAINVKEIVEMLIVPKVKNLTIRIWQQFISGEKRSCSSGRRPIIEEVAVQVRNDRRRMAKMLRDVCDVAITELDHTTPS